MIIYIGLHIFTKFRILKLVITVHFWFYPKLFVVSERGPPLFLLQMIIIVYMCAICCFIHKYLIFIIRKLILLTVATVLGKMTPGTN